MIDTSKLNKWADLLLNTGKRNNLINFKDSKTATAEVIYPDFFKAQLKLKESSLINFSKIL